MTHKHLPSADRNSPTAVARYVIAECRDRGLGNMVEAVLHSGGSQGRAQAVARIEAASEIAGLCLAAKRPGMAADFVITGLGVEHVRKRLFDMVVDEAGGEISNVHRPLTTSQEGPLQAGPFDEMAGEVYAKRRRAYD